MGVSVQERGNSREVGRLLEVVLFRQAIWLLLKDHLYKQDRRSREANTRPPHYRPM